MTSLWSNELSLLEDTKYTFDLNSVTLTVISFGKSVSLPSRKSKDDKALFDVSYYNSEDDLKQFIKDIDDTNVIKYQSKTTVHEKTEIQKRMLKTIQQTFINYIYLNYIEDKDILKNTIINEWKKLKSFRGSHKTG